MNKIPAKVIGGITIALCFGIALFLRVYFPYDQVFSGDWIKFTGVDAYYHMRLVDNLVRNFPHLISFDPYFIYPGGTVVDSIHFFNWLLAGIIWVIGLGSPTEHTVDVIAVYFPAVLGALTVIPVYFIGKELFGRWVGVISAALLAILPGEFLGRSILGFTDQHVAETLFTTITMLFLILAIKTSRQGELTLNHLWQRDWAASAKPIIYSLLTGIWLGIYLVTWSGALLFVFIVSVYLVIQFVIDHLRHKSTDYLCVVGVILFLVALIIYAPFSRGALYLVSLGIALVIPIVLSGVSRWVTRREIRRGYYPLVLVGLGGVALAVFYAVDLSLLSNMLSRFSIVFTWREGATTMEMQPLLSPRGQLTLSLAWGNFTTSFFLSLISLGILAYLVIKQGGAEKNLLVVWSLVILAATLGQRRFAYYFAVNAALLTGYASWQLLRLAGFKKGGAKPVAIPPMAAREETKLRKKRQDGFDLTIRHINMALAVIIVFFLVFYPNIGPLPKLSPKVGPAIATARAARFAPSDAWQSSLTWLKENTPDPFGNSAFYYQFYEPPKPGEGYRYPESAYGIMAWWDYGYWITRIAHRLPNANGRQDPSRLINTANFFLSQDEDSAEEILKQFDSNYIVIDYQTTTAKLWAIAQWAELDSSRFFDFYLLPQKNKLAVFFSSEYYRSLVVRLYNFDGQAVTPGVSKVLSYEERVLPEGQTIKLVTDVQTFNNYEAAAAYISRQNSANYRIVSDNPFSSPVPLDRLKDYRLVHGSDGGITLPGMEIAVPKVKIFEYIGDRAREGGHVNG